MRRTLPVLIMVAALAGCGGSDDPAKGVAQVDQQLASDNLIDNDLTAIDAVTGSDANMAADVDPSSFASNASGDNSAAPSKTKSTAPAKKDEPADTKSDEEAPAKAPAPAANTTTEN